MSSSCTNSSLVIPINYHLTIPLSVSLPHYFYFLMLLLYFGFEKQFSSPVGSSGWSYFLAVFGGELSSRRLFCASRAARWSFRMAKMVASLLSWYSPICKAVLNNSFGSNWSLVSASASMSSEGHQRIWSPEFFMHCLRMAKSMATRLSSHLDTDDKDDTWSYRLLQSVIPTIETIEMSSLHFSCTCPTAWLCTCSLVRRSNDPWFASASNRDIHSATALAEALCFPGQRGSYDSWQLERLPSKRWPLAGVIFRQVFVHKSCDVSSLGPMSLGIPKCSIWVKSNCNIIPRNRLDSDFNIAVLLGSVN